MKLSLKDILTLLKAIGINNAWQAFVKMLREKWKRNRSTKRRLNREVKKIDKAIDREDNRISRGKRRDRMDRTKPRRVR